MSRENVDRVRRAFEALEREGVEGLLDFIDLEFEASTPPELSLEPTTYRGHDGIRRYFETFYEVMDEVRYEPEEFIDAGDCVVVPTRLVARGRGTGIETGQNVVLVFTMREGLATRIDVHPTKAQALAAVGLEPGSSSVGE
jgi:ketosteroid isomerase-like protein